MPTPPATMTQRERVAARVPGRRGEVSTHGHREAEGRRTPQHQEGPGRKPAKGKARTTRKAPPVKTPAKKAPAKKAPAKKSAARR